MTTFPVKDSPGDHVSGEAVVLAVRLLDVLEHERMVAQLAQLHDGVHERLGAAAAAAALPVRQHDALALHVPVQQPLQRRHLALDDVLHLAVGKRTDVK